MPAIRVEPVRTKQGRRSFVKFPWQIYKDNANWVPPLIPERLEYLDPERGLFYQHAEVALFAARRDGETVGTIAPFVDRHFVEHVGERQGGFGFFEVVEDYAVARELLDTARQWLRDRGMVSVRGPTSFSDNDSPGVLVEATDCPPVILEAHTPPKIREAAVVGVPAAMTGESVWAFVILEDGVRMTAQQVLSYCRQEMEPHMIPSEVRFVTHFPCSQSGKVRKVELRARALQQMQGREPT